MNYFVYGMYRMEEDKIERLRERLLLCPICMDEFQDPRLLPCYHTMCSQCIHNLLTSTNSGRFFRCPQCRRDVNVPRGGVSELPVNFFVRSLQDELSTGVEVGPCQLCHLGFSAPQFRCVDCDLDICRFCIHAHRLVQHKDSTAVNILRMEVNSPIGAALGLANQMCAVHTNEPVQLFCESCERSVCVSCSCGEHRKHIVMPLSKKMHHAQQHLQQQLELLMQERRTVRAWLRQLEGAEVEAKDNSKSTLDAVELRIKELQRLLDQMAAAFVEKIQLQEQKQLTGLKACKDRLEVLLQRVELGISFLKGLEEGDVCLELLDAYKAFSTDLEQLRQNTSSVYVVPLCDQHFSSGIHLHLGNYIAAKIGTLSARHTNLLVGKHQPPLHHRLLGHIHLRVLVISFLALAMLYTLMALCYACYETPDCENILAFVFSLLLSVAACCAYHKS